LQEIIPAPKPVPRPRFERRHFAYIERRGRVLLVRNPERGLLASLWMVPGGGSRTRLAALVREQTGLACQVNGVAATARHDFSHRTWRMTVHRAAATGTARRGGACAWIPKARLGQAALPAAMRRLLVALEPGIFKTAPGSEGHE
jgi:adenine-specific DNA glycosylase